MFHCKFNIICLIFLINLPLDNAVYGRVPGERYLEFLKMLPDEVRSTVRGIIFDPNLTKDQARAAIEDWAHEESPLTMQHYDRSQMDYELQSRRNERILDRRAQNYSEEGKLLDKRVREIYNNGTLTERQACDAAANLIKMATPQTVAEVDLELMDCDQIFTSIFD